MLLCSSVVVRFIEVQDETGLVLSVTACEKRIRDMVSDSREIMLLLVVVHVDCSFVNGVSV